MTEWPASGTRESVVARYNGQQFGLFTQRAIRTRRWKDVWSATDVDELYDLQNDPAEMQNLSDDAAHAAAIASLRRDLCDHLQIAGDTQVTNP